MTQDQFNAQWSLDELPACGERREFSMDESKSRLLQSEHFPEKDIKEELPSAIVKAALSSIPYAGGALAELINLYFASAVEERRKDWLNELALVVKELKERLADVEKRLESEEFQSAIITATRVAVATGQKDKLRYLRNALINIGCQIVPYDDLRSMFFNYVDQLTLSHIKVLDVLSKEDGKIWVKHPIDHNSRTARQALLLGIPELNSDHLFLDLVANDLRIRGLGKIDLDLSVPNSSPGQVNDMGTSFLKFILLEGEAA